LIDDLHCVKIRKRSFGTVSALRNIEPKGSFCEKEQPCGTFGIEVLKTVRFESYDGGQKTLWLIFLLSNGSQLFQYV
jgi:hypothetical protein